MAKAGYFYFLFFMVIFLITFIKIKHNPTFAAQNNKEDERIMNANIGLIL